MINLPIRRPYLVYLDGDGIVVGALGPYRDTGAAQRALGALLAAERWSMEGLVLDQVPPAGQCIPAFYDRIQLIDLDVDEIRRLGAAGEGDAT